MLRVLQPGGKLILTYDLVLNGTSRQDARLVEIFTPQMICNVLEKFGIKAKEIHSTADVVASLGDIRADRVNIASDITVGGFVLSKSTK